MIYTRNHHNSNFNRYSSVLWILFHLFIVGNWQYTLFSNSLRKIPYYLYKALYKFVWKIQTKHSENIVISLHVEINGNNVIFHLIKNINWVNNKYAYCGRKLWSKFRNFYEFVHFKFFWASCLKVSARCFAEGGSMFQNKGDLVF